MLAAGLFGCGSSVNYEEAVAGKTFYYENDGFGGTFSIQLKEDGSFEYYEGSLSSYMAHGKWSISDDTLTLEDTDYQIVNHFQIDGDKLRFLAKDSSNFMYVQVKDGETFHT